MDPVLEAVQRQSEIDLRTKNLPQLLKRPYDWKKRQADSKITEFEQVLGLGTIYVSTSGGKDSSVLSRIAKNLYPNIQHIMFDTGLEYQAVKDIAKRQGAQIIKPCRGWVDFCEEKGYPITSKQVSKRIHDARISPLGAVLTMYSKVYHLSHKWLHLLEMADFPISHRCCDEFKKRPAHQLKLNPIIATRVSESAVRKSAWKKSGCNSYSEDGKHGISRPMSLWTDDDVNRYVIEESVELSEIYTQYEQKRTGCIICPFGAHLEEKSRFELLKKLEPKRYDYFMHTRLRDILALQGVEIPSDPEYTEYLESVQKDVRAWHQDRDYRKFKREWLLNHYSRQEILEAIDHLGADKLMYPMEELKSEFLEGNNEW